MLLFRLHFLLCSCLLVSYATSPAQVIYSQTLSDTDKEPLIITRYVSVLTTDSSTTIDSIHIANFQKRFIRAPDRPVVFLKYDDFIYWFRIIIKNKDSLSKDLMLLMAPVGMRKGQLWQRKGESWTIVGTTGYEYPFLKRPYQYSSYVFPITVRASLNDTLFLKMDAQHSFKSYGFALLKPKALKALENRVYFYFGAIVGLLLLSSLFNIYLYFTLHDRMHLLYAVYILMLILIVIKNDQLDQEFLGWDNEKAYMMTSIMGIGAVAIALLMHVVQLFLMNKVYSRYLHVISTVVKINALLSGVAQLAAFYAKINHEDLNRIFSWAQVSTLLAICIIILNCIYSLIKGDERALFIFAGLLVFLAGAVQRLLLAGTASYFNPPQIFHVGMVMETLIISFGFIYRHRIERNEKQRFLMEKENLESKKETLLLESKIEIQDQTLKTIFEETNSHIGQYLSLIQYKLQQLKTTNTNNVERKLDDVKKLLTSVIGELRNLCKILDTDYVRDLGLAKAIEYDLEQVWKSRPCTTIFQKSGDPYRIDPEKELILFRLYQEILNSIYSFSTGKLVLVKLHYDPILLVLTISFNDTKFIHEAPKPKVTNINSALLNMHIRASLINAAFNIGSQKSSTIITISLPTDR